MPSPFPIPLNALRAIEIVARRGALAPAAEELGVTPGAVSQHLRRAEERLGLELFERTPQGLRPTPALQQILPQLSNGFAALQDALAGLRVRNEMVLSLTVGSVFASRWLIWRIGKFSALHPDIEVRLVVSGQLLDLHRADIDCAIRFGRGDWPGVQAERLGPAPYSPVCAPPLAPQLANPGDLARVPVIRDTSTMLSWDAWFAAAGLPPPALQGPTYDDPALAFDAAISGQGVLLTVDRMSADAVSDGRLVRPFAISAESGVAYWLVVAEGRREPRKTRLFREWLRVEVPDSEAGYVAQMRG
ncbi:MAG TPA: LysR substrate-binding domain-containing protein [Devosiaceae bacterium]|jgi:DNA-binding transcriptional LysR family regulator|nr:LysR substrate-binding domain-containing protein [Devosiaceae bacterium]